MTDAPITQNHTRDLPVPKYEIMQKIADAKTETGSTEQWLIKTKHLHTIRVLPEIKNGKVMPTKYGETNHVVVTAVEHILPNGKRHRETTVFASDEAGTFYNAPMYVTTGLREVWEVMFAIGEV